MAVLGFDDVELYYEHTGDGDTPLVLVHGSWISSESWTPVVAGLAQMFSVVRYDRRGHSRSSAPPGQGSVHEDVADLADLIEALGMQPAWVVGNSFGGSIALRLATARPDLVRGIIVHEPPAFGLLAKDPAFESMMEETTRRVGAVIELLTRGDHAEAAERFVETVALGPGSWSQFTRAEKRIVIENAPTFLDETRDPEALDLDLSGLARLACPCLLTLGDQSPPTFAPVVGRIAAAAPQAHRYVFRGHGHVPHLSDPEGFVATVTRFTGQARTRR